MVPLVSNHFQLNRPDEPTETHTNINNVPQEETFHAKPIIRLPYPDILKSILVDDWENVTRNNQLVKLPSATPVSVILDDYCDFEIKKRAEGSAEADILQEVTQGLKKYMNIGVGKILLYKQERPQYLAIWKRVHHVGDDLQGKLMSEIYGAEHLLRLMCTSYLIPFCI
jgi:mortality factor 4-like protein 1